MKMPLPAIGITIGFSHLSLKKLAVIIPIAFLLISFHPAFALTFKINRVTNDNNIDFASSLHNDLVCWARETSLGPQVFTWNGAELTQITSDSRFKSAVSCHSGKIAYLADEVLPGNVFAYYLYYWNGTAPVLIANQSLNNKQGLFTPSLYNGKIAWAGWDGTDNEIYYWDGATTRQITNNSVADSEPKLFNGTIAWVQINGANYEIYYWNGTLMSLTDQASGRPGQPVDSEKQSLERQLEQAHRQCAILQHKMALKEVLTDLKLTPGISWAEKK
jgi:hypothetical protein